MAVGQKLPTGQKTYEQIKTELQIRLQDQVHKVLMSQQPYHPIVKFAFMNRLGMNPSQQNNTIEGYNYYTPNVRYDAMFRVRINQNIKIVANGAFYGIQGIKNVYTLGCVLKF